MSREEMQSYSTGYYSSGSMELPSLRKKIFNHRDNGADYIVEEYFLEHYKPWLSSGCRYLLYDVCSLGWDATAEIIDD